MASEVTPATNAQAVRYRAGAGMSPVSRIRVVATGAAVPPSGAWPTL